MCMCAHVHTHTHTHTTLQSTGRFGGGKQSRKEIQRKTEKHNKHSSVFPLKFIHIYLLQLKKLKTGRRRNIWTKDRENSK